MLVFATVALVGCLVLCTPALLRRLIRWRLKGYSRLHNEIDAWQPERIDRDCSVAVIGSGVAGLTAAVTLARRGYQVTLFEKNSYLGGKLGSFEVDLGCENRGFISHGFHAFFNHYYNLNRFLDSLNLRRGFASVGDYVILGKDGQVLRFARLATTPILNLFSLMRAGMFKLKDALAAPGRDLYGVFLEYDADKTFQTFDHMSYGAFSRLAQVPPRLKLAFNTFARAFFADEEKLSFAELIKSFHFYYLSHDGGLVYQYPTQDYEDAFLKPIRRELLANNATILMETPVSSLAMEPDGFLVNGQRFNKVINACDVVGTARLFKLAENFPEQVTSSLSKVRAGQRYAMLRLWLDTDIRKDLPVFVITEKVKVLDSVTTYHRFELQAKRQMSMTFADGKKAKSILELHCYSVPDELEDGQVAEALFQELVQFFPELQGATRLSQYFQLRDDFTAFHVGLDSTRPPVETGVLGLYCCGDWVKLPFPAMLLEAACASGLLAANAILGEDSVRQVPIFTVPLQGLMVNVQAPPARARLLGSFK